MLRKEEEADDDFISMKDVSGSNINRVQILPDPCFLVMRYLVKATFVLYFTRIFLIPFWF